MARITQKQIAAELGVSATTVSFVVTDPETRRVARKTRERIVAYMNRRAPDLLPNGNHCAICFLIPESIARSGSNYEAFYAPVLHGVEAAAKREGRVVVFMRWRNPRDLKRDLSRHPFAGILCVNDPPEGFRARRDGRSLPMVVVNARPFEPVCDSFSVDDRRAFAKAVRYLHRRGHRRIAYVGPRSVGQLPTNGSHRTGGYLDGMRSVGLPVRPEYEDAFDKAHGDLGAALSGLMQLAESPTALLAYNDEVAIRLIETGLERIGLSIPDDLSVIGYDDTIACRSVVPPLTSFRQPREEMGRRAMEALLARMEGDSANRPVVHTLFEAELVERQSVATLSEGNIPNRRDTASAPNGGAGKEENSCRKKEREPCSSSVSE